jgi:hypothetical protein
MSNGPGSVLWTSTNYNRLSLCHWRMFGTVCQFTRDIMTSMWGVNFIRYNTNGYFVLRKAAIFLTPSFPMCVSTPVDRAHNAHTVQNVSSTKRLLNKTSPQQNVSIQNVSTHNVSLTKRLRNETSPVTKRLRNKTSPGQIWLNNSSVQSYNHFSVTKWNNFIMKESFFSATKVFPIISFILYITFFLLTLTYSVQETDQCNIK